MARKREEQAKGGVSHGKCDAHTVLVALSENDDFIRSRIFSVRGVQVMLDSDLAGIYQVETRVFNQSVKRNESRFPPNFRFRLSMEEYRSLISQIVTSKEERGETRGGRQNRCRVSAMGSDPMADTVGSVGSDR